LRASFFRTPLFTRYFILWLSYRSFLPGFTLSGFPDKICGFRNLNLLELCNTKRRRLQWLKKLFRARKPKRGRSQNSLYLPVIINEYENRPKIATNGVKRSVWEELHKPPTRPLFFSVKKNQPSGWASFFEARFSKKAFAFWFPCHGLRKLEPSRSPGKKCGFRKSFFLLLIIT